MSIAKWRNKIDEIDLKLLQLLNERAQCAIEIGHIKAKEKLPVHDPSREDKIKARLLKENTGPLSAPYLEKIYRTIIHKTRRTESEHSAEEIL